MARISTQHYVRALVEASVDEKNISSVVRTFVSMLKRRHEEALLPLIVRMVEKHQADAAKKETLFVRSGHEVDEKTLHAVKKALNVEKDAPVTVIRDETVVGGVEARYGDTTLPASIPSLFTHWKRTL